MNLSNILADSSWTGIGAIAGIITLIITIIALWFSISLKRNVDKESSNSLEFEEILSMFSVTPDVQGNAGALNWYAGASEKSPIKWGHTGLKYLSDLTAAEARQYPKSFGFTFREGKVVITNNNIPSHFVLREVKTPVEWTIRMFGIRNGADIVTISNHVSSPIDGELKSPKKYIKSTKTLCESNAMMTSEHIITIDKVKILKKRNFWLVTKSYCGGVQTQCNYEYIIFLQKPRGKEIEELTEECVSEIV